MLLICRPAIGHEDFERIDGLLTALPHAVRWARRADRLVVQVPGASPGDPGLDGLAADPAVEFVLRDPSPEEATRLFSRRDLLDVALASTGVLAAACLLGPVGLYVHAPPGERGPHGDVLIGRADAIPVGGALARVVDGQDIVIIRRDEASFVALSATCTHKDICLVSWDPGRRQLLCPCHQGVFDMYGNVVSGPPPRPLAGREIVVRDGSLYVRRGS